MEHTKLPWEMTKVPFELRNTDDVACIYGKATENGSPLIACISRSPGDKEAEANADLIFKAAMNHQKLVDALEGMVDTFKQFRDNSNRCGDALNDAEELLNEITK